MKIQSTWFKASDLKRIGCYIMRVKGSVLGLHTDRLVDAEVVLYEYHQLGDNTIYSMASLYGNSIQCREGEVLYPVNSREFSITDNNWWVIGERGNLILCGPSA